MSTAIVEVQTAVAEFDKVAAGIGELKAKYGSVAALKKSSDAELIGVLCEHYQAPEAKVIEWLKAMKI